MRMPVGGQPLFLSRLVQVAGHAGPAFGNLVGPSKSLRCPVSATTAGPRPAVAAAGAGNAGLRMSRLSSALRRSASGALPFAARSASSSRCQTACMPPTPLHGLSRRVFLPQLGNKFLGTQAAVARSPRRLENCRSAVWLGCRGGRAHLLRGRPVPRHLGRCVHGLRSHRTRQNRKLLDDLPEHHGMHVADRAHHR